MADEDRRRIAANVVSLRRGWGLQRARLLSLMEPEVISWCGVSRAASDAEVRRAVMSAIARIPEYEMSAEERRIAEVAFALDVRIRFPDLSRRSEVLATQTTRSPRTVRRLINAVCEKLVDDIIAVVARQAGDDDPETGWYVRELDAVLRLDSMVPEVIERRVIVAERDGLRRIAVRFSLPVLPEVTCDRKLDADVHEGARLLSHSREGQGHFRYEMELSGAVPLGEQHTFAMTLRVLDGAPIRDYFALVPLVRCERFRIRARFSPDALPRRVWRLDRVPQRVLSDPLRPGTALALDGALETVQVFDRPLLPGYGYGIAWEPAPHVTVLSG